MLKRTALPRNWILGLILGPVLFAILITVWRDATGDGSLQDQA